MRFGTRNIHVPKYLASFNSTFLIFFHLFIKYLRLLNYQFLLADSEHIGLITFEASCLQLSNREFFVG